MAIYRRRWVHVQARSGSSSLESWGSRTTYWLGIALHANTTRRWRQSLTEGSMALHRTLIWRTGRVYKRLPCDTTTAKSSNCMMDKRVSRQSFRIWTTVMTTRSTRTYWRLKTYSQPLNHLTNLTRHSWAKRYSIGTSQKFATQEPIPMELRASQATVAVAIMRRIRTLMSLPICKSMTPFCARQAPTISRITRSIAEQHSRTLAILMTLKRSWSKHIIRVLEHHSQKVQASFSNWLLQTN